VTFVPGSCEEGLLKIHSLLSLCPPNDDE